MIRKIRPVTFRYIRKTGEQTGEVPYIRGLEGISCL